VWKFDLNPVRGHEQGGKPRPNVIISVHELNCKEGCGLVVAIPGTGSENQIRIQSNLVIQEPEGGVDRRTAILPHAIRSLDTTARYQCDPQFEGTPLSPRTLAELEQRLAVFLGLSPVPAGRDWRPRRVRDMIYDPDKDHSRGHTFDIDLLDNKDREAQGCPIPCVILSANGWNYFWADPRNTLIVAPITAARLPFQVPVFPPEGGLVDETEELFIQCSQIRQAALGRLLSRRGSFGSRKMHQVSQQLFRLLQIREP
jgi:mRNA-degrading endonuclease toxin of MazEF toxin-antitoxin module